MVEAMSKSYKISYSEQPTLEEESVLLEGIKHEAAKAKGLTAITPFAFFMRDDHNTIVAGIKGASYYGCLYIDSLWVSPKYRNRGWGSELVRKSEKLAHERKCTFISLTTMDWEALPFYQKLGYQIEYVREGYEKSSKMYVLRKNFDS